MFIDTIEVNLQPLNISNPIQSRLIIAILLLSSAMGYAQVEQQMLLSDMQVQIEATEAVNDMYNFKFEKAEQQFRWLKQKYAWHPLPYFLLGLSEWWKIMPNTHESQ